MPKHTDIWCMYCGTHIISLAPLIGQKINPFVPTVLRRTHSLYMVLPRLITRHPCTTKQPSFSHANKTKCSNSFFFIGVTFRKSKIAGLLRLHFSDHNNQGNVQKDRCRSDFSEISFKYILNLCFINYIHNHHRCSQQWYAKHKFANYLPPRAHQRSGRMQIIQRVA